jgi:hypothetical protein
MEAAYPQLEILMELAGMHLGSRCYISICDKHKGIPENWITKFVFEIRNFSDQEMFVILWSYLVKKKVKISLLQAVEAPRVARGRDSHIT